AAARTTGATAGARVSALPAPGGEHRGTGAGLGLCPSVASGRRRAAGCAPSAPEHPAHVARQRPEPGLGLPGSGDLGCRSTGGRVSEFHHDSALERAFKALEADLMRDGGAQISTTRRYNFAIVPYEPDDEFALRRLV